MAIAATLLTQGSSTTDGTTYTTASVTPTADALLLAIILHGSVTANFGFGDTCVGNGVNWMPIAFTPLDPLTGARTSGISVWAGTSVAPSAGTIVFSFTGTQQRASWAIVQVTGQDTTVHSSPSVYAGVLGCIRQTTTDHTSGDAATSCTAMLGAPRAAGNGVIGIFGHLVNEATTPGTGLTELADQATAEATALEVSWAAAYQNRLSASWSTSTALWGCIGLEIAVAGNSNFVADPVAGLYT